VHVIAAGQHAPLVDPAELAPCATTTPLRAASVLPIRRPMPLAFSQAAAVGLCGLHCANWGSSIVWSRQIHRGLATAIEDVNFKHLTIAPDGTLILKDQTRPIGCTLQGTMAIMVCAKKGMKLPNSVLVAFDPRTLEVLDSIPLPGWVGTVAAHHYPLPRQDRGLCSHGAGSRSCRADALRARGRATQTARIQYRPRSPRQDQPEPVRDGAD